MERVVVDGRNHMIERLAWFVAKELLKGGRLVVVVRCEEICLDRLKMEQLMHEFKRKERKPLGRRLPLRAPSSILKRRIQAWIPRQTKEGMSALARLKVYEGVPPPYDEIEKTVIPDALNSGLSPQEYCSISRLLLECGWDLDTVKKLEKKSKENEKERRKKLKEITAKDIETITSQLQLF